MKRLERLERLELSAGALRLVRAARVAHLATADRSGKPLVIPICFVFDGKEFFSSIDEKPKRLSPRRLKRLRNIEENSQVSLVIDRWDEDWRKLAYILVSGRAEILLTGQNHRRAVSRLRRKYRQYRSMALEERPIIVIRPLNVKLWGNL
ncbi:MAG TPA: TIGR03668 family PPOX class F420-dependent oxidoreductase [Candidatus Binatia bacterium]|nr:TIGR03668 family PPOX class F420-dependent oxidoreductase [Candidatus Binatia bacterium]